MRPTSARLLIPLLLASWLALVWSTGCDSDPTGTREGAATASVAEGAEVWLHNGARLLVPPGAVEEDTHVSMKVVAADDAHGATPVGLASIGERYEVDLGTRTLNIPAAIELPVVASSTSGLFLAYFDEASGGWVPSGGAADADRGVITTEIEHASWWSVFTQTVAGAPLEAADRRPVFLPSIANPLHVCPFISEPEDTAGNPCKWFDNPANDRQLDPINLVFHGVDGDQIEEMLGAWADPQSGQRWEASANDALCARIRGPSEHSLWAALAGSAMSPMRMAGQRFLGGCLSQYHIRWFTIPGSNADSTWILAAVHYDVVDPEINDLSTFGHQPGLPWESAEGIVTKAFEETYDVRSNALLVQRNCPLTCVFRGQSTNGWATLITKKGDRSVPRLTLAPDHSSVGGPVTALGEGFPANREIVIYGDAGRHNVVRVDANVARDDAFVVAGRTDAVGSFRYEASVPYYYTSHLAPGLNPVPPGRYTIRAQVMDDSRVFAERLFDVVSSPPGCAPQSPPSPACAPSDCAGMSPPGGCPTPRADGRCLGSPPLCTPVNPCAASPPLCAPVNPCVQSPPLCHTPVPSPRPVDPCVASPPLCAPADPCRQSPPLCYPPSPRTPTPRPVDPCVTSPPLCAPRPSPP
jgi:hypothetical protein